MNTLLWFGALWALFFVGRFALSRLPERHQHVVYRYFHNARARAKKKRSPWDFITLLVGLGCIGFAWWGLASLGSSIHASLFDGQRLMRSEGLGALLVAVAPFFVSVPFGLICGNLIMWLIPHARRTMDGEAGRDPHMTFLGSMRDLLIFGTITTSIALPLTIWGILLPWRVAP